MFWRSTKKKLVFVYGEKYRNRGATIMRGLQLSEMMDANFSNIFDVTYRPIDLSLKNSIIFLTKGAIQSLNETSLNNLKKPHNKLLFDPVDSLVPDGKVEYADAIIAASEAALIDYRTRYSKSRVHLIDHHADPRLQPVSKNVLASGLKVGYFGELVNTIETPAINKRVDFILVDTSQQEESWLQTIWVYNAHYCLRNNEMVTEGTYKPFTKGIIAARLGVNVLVHESQTDAVRWLGEDYPYLMRTNVDEKHILEALNHMQDTYGTKVWDNALDSMRQVRAQSSSQVICAQLKALINSL